jgi:hypothetical protein
MLANIVHSSLKDLLGLLFVLVVEIQILNGKLNIAFPEFYLCRVVSDGFLKPMGRCKR